MCQKVGKKKKAPCRVTVRLGYHGNRSFLLLWAVSRDMFNVRRFLLRPGWAHLLRLSLLCRTGVYRALDIRPSEVVVSTAALLCSPGCTGLDW